MPKNPPHHHAKISTRALQGDSAGSTWHFCPAQPKMQHLLQSITDPEGPPSPWAAWAGCWQPSAVQSGMICFSVHSGARRILISECQVAI